MFSLVLLQGLLRTEVASGAEQNTQYHEASRNMKTKIVQLYSPRNNTIQEGVSHPVWRISHNKAFLIKFLTLTSFKSDLVYKFPSFRWRHNYAGTKGRHVSHWREEKDCPSGALPQRAQGVGWWVINEPKDGWRYEEKEIQRKKSWCVFLLWVS